MEEAEIEFLYLGTGAYLSKAVKILQSSKTHPLHNSWAFVKTMLSLARLQVFTKQNSSYRIGKVGYQELTLIQVITLMSDKGH